MSATGIGAPVRRKEDHRFITGQGRYTDDINRPGQAHAYFLRSPHAHATLKKIDTKAAAAMPGVLGIFTGDDLAADKVGGLICGWMIHNKDGSPMRAGPHPALAQGKVRYVGCSNMPAWQVADAQWTARDLRLSGFASAQDEYSLLVRGAEKELIPAISHFGMGLLPYFPLANGLLTGKYQRNAPMPEGARMTREAQRAGEVLTEANWAKTEKLAAFCEARGKTLLELAFSWLAAQPVVSSVIAGATKPEQVAANVKAADWALTPEELAEIDAITR